MTSPSTTLEDLNKNQIILLVLLISFVSSVATGIITTSLLAQAPVNVTNTINRVVEHTIEKVTPATAATKEVSLNKEDKALLAAVSRAADVVVYIHETTSAGMATSSVKGVIVSKEGLVVSPLGSITSSKTYVATLSDDTKLSLSLATTSPADNLAIFQIITPAVAQ